MASKRIIVQQYDNGIVLSFKIKKDHLVEPLFGSTVLLKLKHSQTGLEMTRTCTITDSAMGECEYILTSKDLQVSGGYITEVETTYANGTKLSAENPIILVVTPEQIKKEDE